MSDEITRELEQEDLLIEIGRLRAVTESLEDEAVGRTVELVTKYRRYFMDKEAFLLGLQEMKLDGIAEDSFRDLAFWDGFLFGGMALTLGTLAVEGVEQAKTRNAKNTLTLLKGGKKS